MSAEKLNEVLILGVKGSGKTVFLSVLSITISIRKHILPSMSPVPRSPTGRISSSYSRLYVEAQRQEEMLASMQVESVEQAKARLREKVMSSLSDGFMQVSVGFSNEKVSLSE